MHVHGPWCSKASQGQVGVFLSTHMILSLLGHSDRWPACSRNNVSGIGYWFAGWYKQKAGVNLTGLYRLQGCRVVFVVVLRPVFCVSGSSPFRKDSRKEEAGR